MMSSKEFHKSKLSDSLTYRMASLSFKHEYNELGILEFLLQKQYFAKEEGVIIPELDSAIENLYKCLDFVDGNRIYISDDRVKDRFRTSIDNRIEGPCYHDLVAENTRLKEDLELVVGESCGRFGFCENCKRVYSDSDGSCLNC